MADNCVTRALSGALETAKIYAGAIRDEFTEKGYYAEKFKGTQGVGDALLRVGSVYKDSGKIALDTAKNAAKNAAKMSLGYKAYEYAKENPEKAKTAAKMTVFPMYGVGMVGAVVADKVKENSEAVKQALKYTVFGVIPLIADMIKN